MKSSNKKKLLKFIGKLEEMQSKAKEIKTACEEISAETEQAYGNKSDKWQESEKGCAEQEIIGNLGNFDSYMDELDNAFDSAISEMSDIANAE